MGLFPPKDNSVLLLVDFQTGFLKPFKEKVVRSMENKLSLLIETCKFYKLPIIVMEQNNDKLGNTTEKIQESLGEFYRPFNKFIFSGMRDIAVKSEIEKQQKQNIIIAGIETHICVLQTTYDLICKNYNVYIISDAVGSRFKEDYIFGLDKLKEVGAKLLSTEMLLFGYLESSNTKDFKHFLPFLK